MKMNRILFVLLVLISVSGCDFFRKVAGRPTSADILAKKAEIEKMKDKAVDSSKDTVETLNQVDSVACSDNIDIVVDDVSDVYVSEEQVKADSLDALRTLASLNMKKYKYAKYKGKASGELSHRYYIIVGSFQDAANADKHIAKIQQVHDVESVKIIFRGGYTAVGVCPRNKLSETADVAESIILQPYCPRDAWVLVNE